MQALEGAGLWLQKRWAEYLAVVSTAVFLPIEIYELIDKVTALKIAALLVNIAILVYLLFAKRLFGLRGGSGRGRTALRERDIGLGSARSERAGGGGARARAQRRRARRSRSPRRGGRRCRSSRRARSGSGAAIRERGVAGAEVGGVAVVELGRLVELGVAHRRGVGAQAADPPGPGACRASSTRSKWVGWAQLTM